MQCPQCSGEMTWTRDGPVIWVEKRVPRAREKLSWSERTPGDRQIWYCSACNLRIEETSQGRKILR